MDRIQGRNEIYKVSLTPPGRHIRNESCIQKQASHVVYSPLTIVLINIGRAESNSFTGGSISFALFLEAFQLPSSFLAA